MTRVVTSVGVAVVPDGHEPECVCPSCLMADMDAHLAGIGIDPAPYSWYDVPTEWDDGVKRQRLAPGVPFTPVKQRRSSEARRGVQVGDEVSPLAGINIKDLPAPHIPADRQVQVRVEDIGAGVWVRLTGWPAGDMSTLLTVSGAVVGGPDRVRIRHQFPDDGPVPGETVSQRIRRQRALTVDVAAYAVQVRDFVGGPDQTLYVPVGGHVELVDDPAEYEARAAHAVAPVFGDGADLVHLRGRKMKADGTPRRNDRWTTQVHPDVSAEQLTIWESGGAYTRLSAVHHTHRPVSGGTR